MSALLVGRGQGFAPADSTILKRLTPLAGGRVNLRSLLGLHATCVMDCLRLRDVIRRHAFPERIRRLWADWFRLCCPSRRGETKSSLVFDPKHLASDGVAACVQSLNTGLSKNCSQKSHSMRRYTNARSAKHLLFRSRGPNHHNSPLTQNVQGGFAAALPS